MIVENQMLIEDPLWYLKDYPCPICSGQGKTELNDRFIKNGCELCEGSGKKNKEYLFLNPLIPIIGKRFYVSYDEVSILKTFSMYSRVLYKDKEFRVGIDKDGNVQPFHNLKNFNPNNYKLMR